MPVLMKNQRLEYMIGLGVEAPLQGPVGLAATLPLQVGGGKAGLRDGLLTVPVRLVDETTLVARVHPGVSVPLGIVQEGAAFRPLSTGSVDPWLGADVVAGGTWLGMGSIQSRVPLVEGGDDLHQGMYLRLDGRVARRIDGAVLWLGTSFVDLAETRGGRGGGAFREVAGILGAVFSAGDKWAVSGTARVPVWIAGGTENYAFSAGLNLQRVFDLSHDEGDEGHEHP